MKKIFIFPLAAVLSLSLLTGCNRNLRHDQTPPQEPPAQPAAQATLVIPPTSAATVEATATQAPPTDIPTVQPTDTIIVPTLGVSQSDTITSQLDSLLNQLDTQLQGVDTIPETP